MATKAVLAIAQRVQKMRNRIPRLTLLQVMKLIIFCAAAFASIAPMLHLWQAGAAQGSAVVLFEAVVVPLVMAILAFVLFHKGSRRDGFITSSLLCSTCFALGFAVYSFWSFTLPTYGNAQVHPRDRTSVAGLATHITAILALSAGFAFLMKGLVRKSRSRAQA